jgi:hypothetical protein
MIEQGLLGRVFFADLVADETQQLTGHSDDVFGLTALALQLLEDGIGEASHGFVVEIHDGGCAVCLTGDYSIHGHSSVPPCESSWPLYVFNGTRTVPEFKAVRKVFNESQISIKNIINIGTYV